MMVLVTVSRLLDGMEMLLVTPTAQVKVFRYRVRLHTASPNCVLMVSSTRLLAVMTVRRETMSVSSSASSALLLLSAVSSFSVASVVFCPTTSLAVAVH